MKRVILPLILSLAFLSVQIPSQAGIISEYKAGISQNREIKNTRESIKKVLDRQDKYTNDHDVEKLSELYADNFVNSDGFNKTVYFDLIKKTWDTYPSIMYETQIQSIRVDGDFAAVQAYETARATTLEQTENIEAYGELRSSANTVYYLQKHSGKWVIVAEHILSEKSQLKYGDARFIKMDLKAPEIINAGDEYTAILDMELTDEESAVATIDRQQIIHPLKEADEAFRQLSDENILERVFVANKLNINEYATASIGIAKAETYDKTKTRVYLSGIAFLMTRVNVIPENKYITIEDKDAQTD